jgi:hypothetical protein
MVAVAQLPLWSDNAFTCTKAGIYQQRQEGCGKRTGKNHSGI